jgi:S1-C subfamily serine protease
VRNARTPRRVRLSREERRRWATAAAVALVAAFVIVSAVNLITRGQSRDTSASQHRTAASGGGAYMGVEVRGRVAGEVVITTVVPGSPAETAGLLPGDQILGMDNTTVTSPTDVTSALAQAKPGQVVSVSAARGAAGFTAQVTVAARPSGQSAP